MISGHVDYVVTRTKSEDSELSQNYSREENIDNVKQ